MPTLNESFEPMYSALVSAFGSAPADFEGLDPFESLVAVLLSRGLAESTWRPVLDGLREADLLTPQGLAEAEIIELGDAVRQKGRSISPETIAPLRHFARWLIAHFDGRIDLLINSDRSAGWLYGELAAIKGVGTKGADEILLHVLKRPAYPVDRSTYRILVRHGWLDPSADYEEARDLLLSQVATAPDFDPSSMEAEDHHRVRLLVNLASGMEQIGRRYCRVSSIQCEDCPLVSLLPEGGPQGAED